MFNFPILLCGFFGLVIIILVVVIIHMNSSAPTNNDTKNNQLTKTIDQQKIVIDDLTKRVKTVQTQNNQLTLENKKYKKDCDVPSLLKKEGVVLNNNTIFFSNPNRKFATGSAAEEFCKIAGYKGLQKKANYDTSQPSCTPGDSWFSTKDGDYYVGYYNKPVCSKGSSEGWMNAHWSTEPDGYAACAL